MTSQVLKSQSGCQIQIISMVRCRKAFCPLSNYSDIFISGEIKFEAPSLDKKIIPTVFKGKKILNCIKIDWPETP